MSYLNIYITSNSSDFQTRCRVATWMAAQAIVSEDQATPNHPARIGWATNVLKDEVKITDRQLAMQVLRNTTIANDPTGAPDDALQFQVDAVLDSIIAIG